MGIILHTSNERTFRIRRRESRWLKMTISPSTSMAKHAESRALSVLPAPTPTPITLGMSSQPPGREGEPLCLYVPWVTLFGKEEVPGSTILCGADPLVLTHTLVERDGGAVNITTGWVNMKDAQDAGSLCPLEGTQRAANHSRDEMTGNKSLPTLLMSAITVQCRTVRRKAKLSLAPSWVSNWVAIAPAVPWICLKFKKNGWR